MEIYCFSVTHFLLALTLGEDKRIETLTEAVNNDTFKSTYVLQKEEADKRAKEEAERMEKEKQEKARREEEERLERKKVLYHY